MQSELIGHWTYGSVAADTGQVTYQQPRLITRVRTAIRRLAADLASYTSDAEVADLLAALADHDTAEAAQMRTILTGNLAHRSTHRSAFAA
jgi:hypothetical protein